MPARVTFKLDKAELLRVAQRAAVRIVPPVTRQILTRARVLSPWDTGLMRGTHEQRVSRATRRRMLGRVASTRHYSLPVHEGQKAHTIRARNKQALRFRYRGRIVIVAKVNHPGAAAQPWLATAAREVAARNGMRFRQFHPKKP